MSTFFGDLDIGQRFTPLNSVEGVWVKESEVWAVCHVTGEREAFNSADRVFPVENS